MNYEVVSAGATSGTITFGPIAATRALCPDPEIGDLMAAQLPNVAGYVMNDGKLALALKMDGGIFEFERID